jgi:hypothetical protein
MIQRSSHWFLFLAIIFLLNRTIAIPIDFDLLSYLLQVHLVVNLIHLIDENVFCTVDLLAFYCDQCQ